MPTSALNYVTHYIYASLMSMAFAAFGGGLDPITLVLISSEKSMQEAEVPDAMSEAS